jgi:hypothetical protein
VALTGAHLARTRTTKKRRGIKFRPEVPHPLADLLASKFQAADQLAQDFKRQHVRDLIAEKQPEARKAVDEILAGFESVLVGCEEYRAALAAVREIVIDTPGLNAQHYGWESRVDDWHKVASAALDSDDIALPRLTAAGEWKADNHG